MRVKIHTGIGYDVHRFAEGRKLILGGIEIPYERGLEGHSDADVLCHAIADAILGALGLPDIGFHFPPGATETKDMSSLEILRKVHELMVEEGASLNNIDSTLIAEEPKILPHIEAMKIRIGEVLQIRPRWVGIKATTNELMGFVGRGEGIAAMATVSLEIERRGRGAWAAE